MKYFTRALCAFLIISAFLACKPRKKDADAKPENPALLIYRSAVTHVNDLVHTRLELEPDFMKKELRGEATLILKPHFYPTDSLKLDAKYMRIERVEIVEYVKLKDSSYSNSNRHAYIERAKQKQMDVAYTYDSLFLRIKLNRVYTRDETYGIVIRYIAQPEKVRSKGSQAISDAKGIYFINTDEKIPGKPVQIWTQGETEAASCWFPTIDAPNQKTSEEIWVTVPEKYKTISNGKLLSSKQLSGNKRQDYWKQDLPHAPYLFVLVIGDFAEVKDQWKGKDVNYYVEPAFEPYARMVFGNTPKMLEFYSNILQVPYPWDKFHQVVVRDFVSGAMENTGCVVHFDRLQHNSREHLDNTHEDIIAHELFHHWFGDLVTCESWSNIPLNESFATYGEYLWYEHQYGRNEADVKLEECHDNYFTEAGFKSENLIRFHYEDREDMFDAHSYQKGGSILHMLRKYVGDEAFFASLKLYLNRGAFKTVEVNDLRMAFEEVTGEDLNWFFNQWFLDKGHPELKVFHQTYNGSGEIYGITVVQKGKNYKLPVDIDVYTSRGVERHRIIVEKDSQTFGISCASKPLCVIFDAENQLLADIEETKTIDGWESQMQYASLSSQKIMALHQLLNVQQDRVMKAKYCMHMLKDSFWHNRSAGLSELYQLGLTETEIQPHLESIREVAMKDPKSAVRREAVYFFRDVNDVDQLKKMLYDSSYSVARMSLMALMSINRKEAFAFADRHREEKISGFQEAIFISIGRSSDGDELDFFIGKIRDENRSTALNSAHGLAYYITYNQSGKADEAIRRLVAMADDKTSASASGNAIEALRTLRTFYSYQLYYYRVFFKDKKSRKKNRSKMEATQKLYDQLETILKKYKTE